ncbi:MAG: nuclear transport factor 2 family protein [Rhodanobacteraceae bacterium]
MKPFVFAAACLVATAAVAAPSSDERALMDLENKISDAYLHGDTKTVEASLDERYTLTNSRALVSHRDDDLRELRAGDPKYTEFRTHEMQARTYGDAGIVIGVVSLKGTSGGKAFDVDMRFTDTFVRSGGVWKMVAAQVTPIPR